MWTWVLAVVGAPLGAALGLLGPVLVAKALSLGTGSYEDFLRVWIASVPGGFALGAFGGALLGRRLASRRGGDGPV